MNCSEGYAITIYTRVFVGDDAYIVPLYRQIRPERDDEGIVPYRALSSYAKTCRPQVP